MILVRSGVMVPAHDKPALSNGAAAVSGEMIAEVGPYEELSIKYPGARTIGGNRFLLIPGLINGHSHGRGLSSFQRGALDDTLESWIWETRKLIPLPVYEDVAYSAVRLLRSGVTAVMHNHLFTGALSWSEEIRQAVGAYENTGLRVLFCPAFRNNNPFVYGSNEAFLASLSPSLQAYLAAPAPQPEPKARDQIQMVKDLHTDHRGSMIRIGFGPLAPQWCSSDLLRQIKKEAVYSGMPIFVHALETVLQKIYGLRQHGKTLVHFMFDQGLLGPGLVLGHCVWPSEEDIQLLAQTRTGVTHHPSSNLRLRAGVAPVATMLQAGIQVGLGLDGQGINDDDDFIEEMKLSLLLHRLASLELDSYHPEARDIFRMATEDNASLLGFGQELGRLEPGRLADMVLLDYEKMSHPFVDSSHDPIDVLLYRGKGTHVDTVMVNGRIVVKGGKVLTIDEDALSTRLAEAASRPMTEKEQALVQVMDELKHYVIEYYKGWPQKVKPEPYFAVNSRVDGLI